MIHRLFCCAFSLFATLASAQSIEFSQGSARINAAAVADGIFRLSVSIGDDAKPIDSVFLAKTFKPMGRLDGNAIVTSAGTLRLDPQKGTYELLDADGRGLIPAGSIIAVADGKTIGLHVGWPADRPFDIYGCGNDATNLIQHQIQTKVSNGIAVEPFFFAPAGFASFAVAQNDNDPATCDGQIDADAVTWKAAGSAMDLYVMAAPTIADATRQLLTLTGPPPVPPRWTLGYLQSRWGWKDPAYITDTLKEFKQRKLPVDAFIFDFEWYTKFPDYELKPEGLADFKDFSFNDQLFPEPARQIRELHDAGVKFVGIRKPRLGNAATLRMVRENQWGFRAKGDQQWDARGLWFASPDARAWYTQQTIPLLRAGVDGWWNDEGEFTYTNYLYWNTAQRAALDAVDPKLRLWTIDRAFQPGLARTGAACWTGDIHADWKALARTPTDLLNWSMAGMPWCGCDIGGFSGQTTPQLLTRWMQAGTFFPVMRAHSEIQVQPHFPWLYGPDAEAAMRKALELRYRLIPMIYSLAHDPTHPLIMRPLAAEYPDDPEVADLSDQWMFGPSLLAAPVLSESNDRTIYLPAGEWFDFFNQQKITGGQRLKRTVPFDAVPLFVRAGSILPLAAPGALSTSQWNREQLQVRVFPGRDASFTLVEDDGATLDYTRGLMRKTEFRWNDATRKLSWHRSGPYDGPDCFAQLVVEAVDSRHFLSIGDTSFPVDGELILP